MTEDQLDGLLALNAQLTAAYTTRQLYARTGFRDTAESYNLIIDGLIAQIITLQQTYQGVPR